MEEQAGMPRRWVLAGIGGTVLAFGFAFASRAQGLGSAIGGLLGKASDASLDKLGQPGAFYNDPAIRIALPLIGAGGPLGGNLGKGLGKALDIGQQLGVTGNITRTINDAAGIAAQQAKPVFRAAIGKLTLADVPGIATQSDGATQYLQRSAGIELKDKLRPLVDAALTQVGAYGQLDRLARGSKLLSGAGITRDKLGNSVTEQALSGIFRYIGAEEGRLRANPLGAAGNVLKGVLGN